MFLQVNQVDASSFVSDIVSSDYRTASVFRKYGIEFCCGGKWPLNQVCESKGLNVELIISELDSITRTIQVSNYLTFADWDIDFIIDYIINIHHESLKKALPEIQEQLKDFVEEHSGKYNGLVELKHVFDKLLKEMLPHLMQEEEIIFPYIRQIAHAYKSNESYASLLVRTLRKPVESVMKHEHETTGKILRRMRELSNNYTPPPDACVKHKVVFSVLKDLDNDLAQHLHLENNILFPKAIGMEKELLQKD